MPRNTLRRAGVTCAVVASLALVGAVAPASPSEAATTPRAYSFLDIYGGKPVRWDPCAPIRYKVNLNGVAASSELSLMKAAFAEAGRAMGGVKFVYAGTTTVVPDGSDDARKAGANVVAAFALPGTGPRKSSFLTGWEAGRASFDTSWGSGDGENIPIPHHEIVMIDSHQLRGLTRTQRSSLYLHEIGHVAGLAHVNDRHQIMYPSLTNTSPGHYQTGDLAGLRLVGRSRGCLEVPARPAAPTLKVSGGNLVVSVPAVRSVSGAVTYTLHSSSAWNVNGRTSTTGVFTVPIAQVLSSWSSPTDVFDFSVTATNRVGQVTGSTATITAAALGLQPTPVDPPVVIGDPANG